MVRLLNKYSVNVTIKSVRSLQYNGGAERPCREEGEQEC